MAVRISMPKLSDTMTEGKLIKWHKKEGDEVHPGDILAEVETDKANMDLESFDKGTMLRCLVKENEKVPVGACLAVLGDKMENVDAFLKEISPGTSPAGSAPRPPESAAPQVPSITSIAPGPPAGDLISAAPPSGHLAPAQSNRAAVMVSPVAARLAADHGIPLESVLGTGPGGRIIKRDIDTILDQGLKPRLPDRGRLEPAGILIENKLADAVIPLEGMRKVIADRMSQSKQTVPHFYLQDDICVDRLVGLRMALNVRAGESGSRFSYNDFAMMGASRTLMMHPALNATFDGIGVHRHSTVDLAFAVSLDAGLITPVVRRCERLTLAEIHNACAQLADRARKMKLKPDEYMGGSFTVTNIGMYGIENFLPIVNPPQVAILAAGAVKRRPCVDAEGHLYVGWRMGVTLACDHRVLDGAAGAAFLRDLKRVLEQPESWAA